MTYLEIVNKVLRLLRETSTVSINNVDDIVVQLVADHVNDAKRTVEDSHNWNMLRYDWNVFVAQNASYAVLAGAGKYAKVDYIYEQDGQELKESTNRQMAKWSSQSGLSGASWYYAVNGLGGPNNDVQLRLYPPAKEDTNILVSGYKAQADLSLDSDNMLVPHQPVIYLALALAARERGEVGGQTAAEIFGMASQYLKDAIANDVALNQSEYDFYVG
jgi:hypothetical protein